jgi:hypothetical protein
LLLPEQLQQRLLVVPEEHEVEVEHF